jgi:hypothetical protein
MASSVISAVPVPSSKRVSRNGAVAKPLIGGSSKQFHKLNRASEYPASQSQPKLLQRSATLFGGSWNQQILARFFGQGAVYMPSSNRSQTELVVGVFLFGGRIIPTMVSVIFWGMRFRPQCEHPTNHFPPEQIPHERLT